MRPLDFRRKGFMLGLLTACLLLPFSAAAAEPKLVAEQHGPDGKKIVIVLNNCDASDMPKGADPLRYDPDNADCVINGDDDLKQLEPITITKGQARGDIILKVINYDSTDREPAVEKVRIFISKDRPAIIGPETRRKSGSMKATSSYTLTDEEKEKLETEDLTLYAEGLKFGASTRLLLYTGGKDPAAELTLHVAPFLLLHHGQAPLRNMVVRRHRDPDLERPQDRDFIRDWNKKSDDYVRSFRDICSRVKTAGRAGVDVQVIEEENGDVWIEDELQWGYTETPRCWLHVALHMYREGDLSRHVRALLGPGVGYFKAFDYAQARPGAMNFGGNLEVTPPAKGKPFGRVYFGGLSSPSTPSDRYRPAWRMAQGFQDFFRRQKAHPDDAEALQEPIRLRTDWLDVGHVDEIVSFVPTSTDGKFVLLWASPQLGLELLDEILDDPQAPKQLDPRYKDFALSTVKQLREAKVVKRLTFLQPGWHLEDYNLEVHQKIAENVEKLKTELGLADDDLRPIPTLFGNVGDYYWQAVALTPGMVNLSSMGRVSMVPKPFIPLFEKKVIETFKNIGQDKPEFIDDWSVYHIALGEVHCGSNMLRKPFADPWWKINTGGGAR